MRIFRLQFNRFSDSNIQKDTITGYQPHMTKSSFYQIVWVYTEEFPGREVPLVLLADGQPGYVVNQWIFYLLEEEASPSRLEQYVRAMCHLYSFALSRYKENFSEKEAESLIADFISAKKYGTDQYCISTDPSKSWLFSLGLSWKPLLQRTQTIALYLDAINKFDEWQSVFHHIDRLNPYEMKLMTVWEIYTDFKTRTQWDPLAHLSPARDHSRKEYKHSVDGKLIHKRHKYGQGKRKCPKAFPLEAFVDLVERSQNPRDKLLWLLMAGGSLRGSETLHLFQSDIEGVNALGEALVQLADPETGMVAWTDQHGQKRHTTRLEYFKKCFSNSEASEDSPLRDLRPRTQYGKRNSGLHAGYKGTTFGDSDSERQLFGYADGRQYDIHHIWWIDPRIGNYFWEVFQEYQSYYLWQNRATGRANSKGWPWHPWLFISTNKLNYGMPLTVPSLKKAWERALKRIGLAGCGLGYHSLRHLYGYYCANVLRLPLETTQILMHHSNVTSTQVYYALENRVVREVITQAAVEQAGLDKDLHDLALTKKPRPSLPPHWGGSHLTTFR